MTTIVLLALLIFVAAALYSSVGHGGASGYLAAMALCGVAPEVMKPAALALNILVAGVATVRFARAGCFSWRLFLPFACLSVPLAYLGGSLNLPGAYYKPLVGAVLLFAAYRLLRAGAPEPRAGGGGGAPLAAALACGAGVGLLSGLTGVGGGIFLSPLLLLTGWADVRRTIGVSAAFVLVNSVAGLGGHLASVSHLPPAEIAWWGAAALVGGVVGTELGRRHMATNLVRRLLAVVLVIAGLKMLFV